MPYLSVGQVYNLNGQVLERDTNVLFNAAFTLTVSYVAPPGLTPLNPNPSISLNTYTEVDFPSFDPATNSFTTLNTKTQTIAVLDVSVTVSPLQGGPSETLDLGSFAGNLLPRGDSPTGGYSDNGVAIGQFLDSNGTGHFFVELQTGDYLFNGRNALKGSFSNPQWQSTTMGFTERTL